MRKLFSVYMVFSNRKFIILFEFVMFSISVSSLFQGCAKLTLLYMTLNKAFSHLYTLNKYPVNKTVLKKKIGGFLCFSLSFSFS